MRPSTTGIEIRTRSQGLRLAVELLSSMRFAIALLTLICIASVIGTVLKQHEPSGNYVNQFGPFWAEVFRAAGLGTVYSTWWFLLILAVLVLSTSLCVARNAPAILRDLRDHKASLRTQSLQAFRLKGQGCTAETPEAARRRAASLLAAAGWSVRQQARPDGTMLAARRGAANRLGYIAAHSAIVLVCIGGLLDGDLVARMQMLLQGKSVYTGGGTVGDVAATHRLAPGTAAFRANLMVSEGARAGTAVISLQDGVVLQELPFDIELKKFVVDYYASGMPRLFSSEIVIHDHATGEAMPASVRVNQPAFHRGVAIYQSSFDDGGSRLRLRAVPFAAKDKPIAIEGRVGDSAPLPGLGAAGTPLTLEFTGLRVINVENFGGQGPGGATDVRGVDLASSLKTHLGSAARNAKPKLLRNIGPSLGYKLRDAAGQAREFNTFMLPVELDGERVFLAGVRDTASEPFRYLRIPVDDEGAVTGWMRLRQALDDPALRRRAALHYGTHAAPGDPPLALRDADSAERALSLFAGGGLPAISDLLERSVPADRRAQTSDVLLRVLAGALYELLNVSREEAGRAALPEDAATRAFMRPAVLALSDSFVYPAPVLLVLDDYSQVQASVFQVARTPGKTLVYLGALLLIAGVLAMLSVSENRLWIWIAPAAGGGTAWAFAQSTARRSLDGDAGFARLRMHLLN